MNVIQIQSLLNQIGEFNISYNEKKQEYLLNGKNVNNIEPIIIEEIQTEYLQKLDVQLTQKSDVHLLKGFLEETHKNISNLSEHYHNYRIKLSKTNPSEEKLIDVFKKICKLIDVKIYCLSEIQSDLENKIKYFDYNIKTDLGEIESPLKEKSFEDEELQSAGLLNLNTVQRYELFKRLGFSKIFDTLDTSQTSKYKLMGIVLNLHPDNTKKLYNGSYREITSKEMDYLDECLLKLKVNLKS